MAWWFRVTARKRDFAGRHDLGAGPRPGGVAGAQGVGVVAAGLAFIEQDFPAEGSAVAQVQRHHVVRLPGKQDHRGFDLTAAIGDAHDLPVNQHAGVTAGVACLGELLRHTHADDHGIVPCQLGEGLGQFLEPGVVGELPAADVWVRLEEHLDRSTAAGSRSRLGGKDVGPQRRRLPVRQSGALDDALLQRGQPPLLKIPGSRMLLPKPLDDLRPEPLGPSEDGLHELPVGLRAVPGRDERLDDGCRAIEGAGVAPTFQPVGPRDVPLRRGTRSRRNASKDVR